MIFGNEFFNSVIYIFFDVLFFFEVKRIIWLFEEIEDDENMFDLIKGSVE